jgi:hypothetical protein
VERVGGIALPGRWSESIWTLIIAKSRARRAVAKRMAEVVPPLRVNNALPCAAVNDDDRFDRDYQVRHRRIGCAVGQYRWSGSRLGRLG